MWLIALGLLCDTFDLGIQSGVSAAVLQSHFANFQQVGLFISSTFAGMTIGGAMAGIVGDRYGRCFCYQFNLLIFGLASFAAALAPSMVWLIIFRGIIGIGLGAEIVVGYSLVAEFMPPESRGRMTAWVVLAAIGLTSPLTALASYLVIPSFGWRWLFVIPAIGAMIIWYLRKDMPESPRWLEAVGRYDEADRIIRRMEDEASRIGRLPALPVAAMPAAPVAVPFSVLFTRRVIRRTLLIMIINIGIGAGYYGFAAFIPTFFIKEGMGIARSLSFSLIIALGATAATVIAWWLSDKIGRKWGIVFSSLGVAATGLVYPHMVQPIFILSAGFVIMTFLTFQMAMGVTMYAPELFPTEYRLRGNAIGNMTGRIASMLAPAATVPLFIKFGVSGVTVTLASLCVVVSAIVAVFGVETRQKSLEGIGKAGNGFPDFVKGAKGSSESPMTG